MLNYYRAAAGARANRADENKTSRDPVPMSADRPRTRDRIGGVSDRSPNPTVVRRHRRGGEKPA
jgi:hypothetical protein